MCGRKVQIAPVAALYVAELLGRSAGEAASESAPSTFNLAPSQEATILVSDGGVLRELRARWGLVPAWAPDLAAATKPINARAETLASKPTFRDAFRKRRCVVFTEGFYEWRRDGRRKTPYFIRMKSKRPYALAGLWERWTPPDAPPGAPPLITYAVITTAANDSLRPIHDRMPAILPPEAWRLWLDDSVERPERLAPLLVPYAGDDLEAFEVSGAVNSPANNGPSLMCPAPSRDDGRGIPKRAAKPTASGDDQLDLFGGE